MSSPDKFSIFTSKEKDLYLRLRSMRDRLVLPIIKLLVFCNIKPDMISYGALVSVIFFAIFFQNLPAISGMFLFFNIFLDSLDGSLARYLKTNNNDGNFLDHFFDYITFIVVLLTIVGSHLGDGFLGIFYLANYLVMQGLVLYGNAKNIRMTVLIRTKVFCYGFVFIWIITKANYFNEFMIGASAVALLTNLYLFYKIRCHSTS